MLQPAGLLTLFVAMVVLAALPSVSTLTVIARSVSLGWRHGAATGLGFVLADLLFILLAVSGLGLIATRWEPAFLALRLLGAAYLFWIAVRLWRTAPQAATARGPVAASWRSSVMLGLALTLGDQKAILFYLAFLPAFVDLTTPTFTQTGAILLLTVIAVGGTKTLFALFAARLTQQWQRPGRRWLPRLAALVLAGAALLLVGQVLVD